MNRLIATFVGLGLVVASNSTSSEMQKKSVDACRCGLNYLHRSFHLWRKAAPRVSYCFQSRHLSGAVVALMLAFAPFFILYPEQGYAQSPEPVPVQPNIALLQAQGHVFKLGEACTRMSKNKPGVMKRDACGRWYCGRTEWEDINEARPNFAAEMGCEWHLVGLHCLCQRPNARPGLPQNVK